MKSDPDQKKRSVIRTPDHHLRIFVSSTLKELAAERKAVYQAITRLRLAPIMFESGARPHPARELYRAYLSQSDIFIGIYWQSYGWIAPDMHISGLEDEYNLSTGLPRLIYLKTPAPDQDALLQGMIDRIRDENASSYKYFSSATELSKLVENDLVLLLTEYFETAREADRLAKSSSASSLTNVPVPRNPLIGREAELEMASRLLLRDDVALVTLTGPAGIGKSRLGIQIAQDMRDKFSNGVYLVTLETIRDPGAVISTIAKTLGIHETAGGLTLFELLKGHLCDKQTLLLLDNFEQVLPAAPLVADLLETCSKMKILVTSRAALHLRAEKELPIPPLKVPSIKETAEIQPISQYSAVQLFIQRCQAVKPSFQITSENAMDVAEICRRLDGLPLAIELAAARIKLFTPQMLLSRLQQRFEVLRGGTKDLPERHHTMYSAIDWSYNLLNEHERQLFRRLSVFCCGFTIESAFAICGVENQNQQDIVDELEQLLDNNLLRSMDEYMSELRMSMYESIREFAHKQFEQSGDIDEIQNRFTQYYLDLSEQAETELQKPAQQEWHRRIENELPNILSAMEWAIEHQNSEIVLRIASSSWRFLWTHGYWREGLQWLKRGLAVNQPISTSVKAKALIRIGWLLCQTGEFDQGIDAIKESLGLWRSTNDQPGIANALNTLGAMLMHKDTAQSVSVLEESVQLRRQLNDQAGIYSSLLNLGIAIFEQGDFSRALEYCNEALLLARQEGDKDAIGRILSNLANVYLYQGNYDQAEVCFSEAEAIIESLGQKVQAAIISANRGLAALKQGNYTRALDLSTKSMLTFYKLGDKLYCILALEQIGQVYLEQEPDRAAKILSSATALRNKFGVNRLPVDQPLFDECLETARKRLGEEAFALAWAGGSRLSLDQAVALAAQTLRGSG